MNRKWKIALGVLTAIIVFCLWYTRPRNFDDLVGSGEFQNFSMLATVAWTSDGKAGSDTWQLDSYEGREETAGMLKNILQSCQYRVSLRSLLPLPNPGPIYGEGNITISFMVVTGVEEGFGAICCGTAVEFTHGGRTFLTQVQDPDITEKILALAQEYGWKTDS